MQNSRGSPGRGSKFACSIPHEAFLPAVQNESDIADAIEQGVWEPREAFFITSKIGPAQVPTALSYLTSGHMHVQEHHARCRPVLCQR